MTAPTTEFSGSCPCRATPADAGVRPLAHMHVIRLLRTVQPEANILAGSALALLLIKILLLNRLPAVFPGAYDLGLLAEAVLASVVASYVFYLFVVHLKEHGERATVRPYVAKHVVRVISDCHSQLQEIAKASAVAIDLETASPDLITSAFAKINPNSDAPLIFSPTNAHANWLQYFSYHSVRSRESITRVLGQFLYIDAQLVTLLTAIDDCSHFHQLEFLRSIRVRNQDLTAWASTFAEYCDLCKQLDNYRSQGLA